MKSVAERLAAKTDSSGGPDACWPWIGAKGGSGTCSIQVGGKQLSARRVIWELARGPIPDEHMVSDSCGNRGCVNPAHLRLRSWVLADRFWEKVHRLGGPDACWPYLWRRTARGYGVFPIGEKGKFPAHRIAYEIAHGVKLTPSQIVMHTCDNPPCCNPAHLELGTHQKNMADMITKGRAFYQKHRAGTARRTSYKLPDALRLELRRRRAAGESIKSIERATGVSGTTISKHTRDLLNGGDDA